MSGQEFQGGGQDQTPGQLQFFDLDDLVGSERNTLAHIISNPRSGPLPGEGSVWKTPRNTSPEFEFGDGVSAVFKSLSVTGPAPAKPGTNVMAGGDNNVALASTRHVLSANTAPFVPSMNMQQHSIPIPIPSMANGGPAHSIHINNFTANLNYPALHPMATNMPEGRGGEPVVSSQYMAAHPYTQGHYYEAAGQSGSGGSHYPGQYPGSLVLFPQPTQMPLHPAAAYHHHMTTQQPITINRDTTQFNSNSFSNGAGITFGSTPVVSIRAGARNSETEDTIQPPGASSFPQPPEVRHPPMEIRQQHMEARHQSYDGRYQQDFRPAQQQEVKTPPTKPHSYSTESTPRPQDNRPQEVRPQPQEFPRAPVVSPKDKIVMDTSKSDKDNSVIQPPVTFDFGQNIEVSPSSKPMNNQIGDQKQPNKEQEQKEQPSIVAKEPEVIEVEEESCVSSNAGSSSWASLFASKNSEARGQEAAAVKPMARIQPFSAAEVSDSVTGAPDNNSADLELGKFLKDYVLKHVSAALLPRGLLNRSNWCFVNAILQALLACPPFYNMMKSLAMVINPLKQTKSKTPMLDSVVEFVSEFSLLETQQINKPQKKDKNRKKDDIVTGISLEPNYVYNMLLNLEDETFKVVDGRQEDAEEFLSCLLNGLSDEMSSRMKLVRETETAAAEANVDEAGDEVEAEDDDWKEVGAKGKSCVTRRVADNNIAATPIQSLALGMCRSCVKSESGDNSATLQPFYTLQLDIQDDSIKSVVDAIGQNFANEKLDGFICSKTKKEIEATRSLSLEELPPILILHLKRFVYDANTGGVQKILKQVEFGVDLEISKSVLSAECRATNKQRQYKLFSVVYHNGREATKGHYVTDIFHSGYSSWLHCDDSQVTPTCEQSVLAPSLTSTPYILLYRRGDTMVGMEKKSQS